MNEAVHFWFDLADPWSWLAMDDVRRIAQEAGRPMVWHPVQLGPAVPYDNPARAALTRAQLERVSQRSGRGVPRCDVPAEVLVEAMAAIHAVPVMDRGPIAEVAMRSAWTGQPLGSELAASTSGLVDAAAEAERVGVFATPSVVIDDVVFWGADRLHFVRLALGLESAPAPFPKASEGRTVRWFHDMASPFSYLASTQIARLEQESGVVVERVPILLGALFRSIGSPMVPMSTFSVPMQRWALRDLMRWAEWWGVPFRFTEHFPLRTVTSLRVALVEPAATDAMYRAAWADNLPMSDDAAIERVLNDAGFDGPALLRAAQEPSIKARLRENTEAAQVAGVCGVPTFQIDGARVLWGQDELAEVGRLLAE